MLYFMLYFASITTASQPPPRSQYRGRESAQLKIIAAQLSIIGAQLIKPILDVQLKMGGGQGDGPGKGRYIGSIRTISH